MCYHIFSLPKFSGYLALHFNNTTLLKRLLRQKDGCFSFFKFRSRTKPLHRRMHAMLLQTCPQNRSLKITICPCAAFHDKQYNGSTKHCWTRQLLPGATKWECRYLNCPQQRDMCTSTEYCPLHQNDALIAHKVSIHFLEQKYQASCKANRRCVLLQLL